MTGTTLGLSYGRSMRSYQSVHFGRRLLCASCAERHDEGSRWAFDIMGAIVGSIIFGLILMAAGVPVAVILFAVCLPWLVAAIWHERAQALRRKSYYRIPGMIPGPHDGPVVAVQDVNKPEATPQSAPENTTRPLPPPDKNDPQYYRSPGQHGDYFDKPHD